MNRHRQEALARILAEREKRGALKNSNALSSITTTSNGGVVGSGEQSVGHNHQQRTNNNNNNFVSSSSPGAAGDLQQQQQQQQSYHQNASAPAPNVVMMPQQQQQNEQNVVSSSSNYNNGSPQQHYNNHQQQQQSPGQPSPQHQHQHPSHTPSAAPLHHPMETPPQMVGGQQQQQQQQIIQQQQQQQMQMHEQQQQQQQFMPPLFVSNMFDGFEQHPSSINSNYHHDNNNIAAAATASNSDSVNRSQTRGGVRHIKPYRSEATAVAAAAALQQQAKNNNNSAAAAAAGEGGEDEEEQRLRRAAMVKHAAQYPTTGGLPWCRHNPFRTQPFHAFVLAPDYSTPSDIGQMLGLKKKRNPLGGGGGGGDGDGGDGGDGSGGAPLNHKKEQLIDKFSGLQGIGSGALGDDEGEMEDYVKNTHVAGDGDFQQNKYRLCEGDWFMKWARHKDKCQKRYFWLNANGLPENHNQGGLQPAAPLQLFWAKKPNDPFSGFASSIKLSDVVALEPNSMPDPVTGATVFIMIVWSTSRTVQLGTEKREKFDLWFDTLMRITHRSRERNAAFNTRHATLEPKGALNEERKKKGSFNHHGGAGPQQQRHGGENGGGEGGREDYDYDPTVNTGD